MANFLRPHLPAGTVLEDRFEIVEILGRGGFATVYQALQRSTNRHIAIKVLDSYPEDEYREMVEGKFQQEAHAIASIRHPNVVTIYDYGIIKDTRQPYIAMEMLAGKTLKGALHAGGAFGIKRAVDLFLPCLKALAQIHNAGIVHRDLKPGNLFVAQLEDGTESMVLLDFGIARVPASLSAADTVNGMLLGTPRYLSPEYINDRIVTPALDVYQITLVFLEALLGVAVVNGANPFEQFYIHVEGKLEIPASLMESPLGPVLQKALAFDHTKRIPDAAALHAAFSALDWDQVPPPCVERVRLNPDIDPIPEGEENTPLEIPAPPIPEIEPSLDSEDEGMDIDGIEPHSEDGDDIVSSLEMFSGDDSDEDLEYPTPLFNISPSVQTTELTPAPEKQPGPGLNIVTGQAPTSLTWVPDPSKWGPPTRSLEDMKTIPFTRNTTETKRWSEDFLVARGLREGSKREDPLWTTTPVLETTPITTNPFLTAMTMMPALQNAARNNPEQIPLLLFTIGLIIAGMLMIFVLIFFVY